MWQRMIIRVAKKFILSQIDTPEFRRAMSNKINRVIDIPGVTEKQEQKIFEAAINGFSDFIRNL